MSVIAEKIKESVSYFRRGQDKEGLKLIGEISGLVREFIEKNKKEAGEVFLSNFSLLIKRLLTAAETGDYILAADVLEYELLPLINVSST